MQGWTRKIFRFKGKNSIEDIYKYRLTSIVICDAFMFGCESNHRASELFAVRTVPFRTSGFAVATVGGRCGVEVVGCLLMQ